VGVINNYKILNQFGVGLGSPFPMSTSTLSFFLSILFSLEITTRYLIGIRFRLPVSTK